MIGYCVLVLALGLVAGEVPVLNRLSLAGLAALENWENCHNFHRPRPGGHAYDKSYVPNPASYPMNRHIPAPLMNQLDFQSHPLLPLERHLWSTHDILYHPVLAVKTSETEAGSLEAYLLPNGLSNIAESSHAKELHEFVKSGKEKTAGVIQSTNFVGTPIPMEIFGLKVGKFHAPPDMKASKLLEILNKDLPIVFLFDKSEKSIFDSLGVVTFDTLNVLENKIAEN